MQDKSLSSGLFFLDLLGAVEPRVVNWSLVTRGMTGRFKKFHEPDSLVGFFSIVLKFGQDKANTKQRRRCSHAMQMALKRTICICQ